jgi:hypothetical protein
MKRISWGKTSLAVVLALTGVKASHADSVNINVTLTQSIQTVTQGTTSVAFDAMISNPSADTIYLNGDSWTTSSAFLAVDDAPFNNNAPLSLVAGASTAPFEIFDVLLGTNTPAGTYGGTFSILGGTDGATLNDLADANFSITVASPPVVVPEPGFLIPSVLAIGAVLVIRQRGSASQNS